MEGVVTQASVLVGTWKLISFERWSNGEVTFPMGRDAQGYISYGSSGWMSCQIMRADRPRLASGKWNDGTLDELRAAVGGYLSYAGTYDVDLTRNCVTHHVDVHLLPNGVGTHLERRFEVNGNRLTLHTSPLGSSERPEGGRLTWERLE
jgi:hypothetical protein